MGELAGGEQPELRAALRYCEAVERAGGLACAVPFSRDAGTVDELLARADGLLFTGADDFDTGRLGLGPTHPAAKPVPARKQDFDLALARRALAEGLPTLGICYGMQLLALAEGARLFQHLPDDRPGCNEHAGGITHDVHVRAGTRLRAVLGVSSLGVISRHHQAVARAGPGWTVAAYDDQELIEGLEREDHPFALGVQWHPELAGPGQGDPAAEPHARLFSALVEAARARLRARAAAEVRV